MSFLDLLQFLAQLLGEFWPWAALIAAVTAAYIYGGPRLAALAGTIGVIVGVYLKGRRDESARAREAARRIQHKREKAYEQIDARNTDARDVAERLRDRSF